MPKSAEINGQIFTRANRQLVFCPENIGEEQKKKIFTSSDVLFSPANVGEEQKKVFTCLDVSLSPENSDALRGGSGVGPPFENEVSKLCKCSTGTCCYFKTAVTEFASHPNQLVGVVVRDIVISAGRDRSRGV